MLRIYFDVKKKGLMKLDNGLIVKTIKVARF